MRVVIDINTIPEKKYDFDVASTESFYNYVSSFLVTDLEKIILQRSDPET